MDFPVWFEWEDKNSRQRLLIFVVTIWITALRKPGMLETRLHENRSTANLRQTKTCHIQIRSMFIDWEIQQLAV